MKQRIAIFMLGFGLILVGLTLNATAQESTDEPTPVVTEEATAEPVPSVTQEATPAAEESFMPPVEISGDNGFCLVCHSQPNQTAPLADGSELNLHVDPEALAHSVHGADNPQGALGCLDCHTDQKFPHGPSPASARVFSLQAFDICAQCHEEQARGQADSVHSRALMEGNHDAATCVDCHGSHEIQPIKDQPDLAAQVCGSCHTDVFDQYKESIHGQALLVNNDTNAPTCIDCHGVHGINDPTTVQARNRSPELCADCHADEKLMKQYDISTNVFNSYVTEFHGSTVALFEQHAPDAETNKAVCYDCHGVHNITPADDNKSQVAKENLLATCQQCHPNATTNFPDSWVGHFEPTADNNPLLFSVSLFYKVLFPSVLGGFGLLVVTDVFSRIRRRGKHEQH